MGQCVCTYLSIQVSAIECVGFVSVEVIGQPWVLSSGTVHVL